MKRPNVKRMQKHAARSTPDRVSRNFDANLIWHGDESPHVKWIRHYHRRMMLKYGPDTAVESYAEQNYITGGIRITVNVVVGSEAVRTWRERELSRALGI